MKGVGGSVTRLEEFRTHAQKNTAGQGQQPQRQHHDLEHVLRAAEEMQHEQTLILTCSIKSNANTARGVHEFLEQMTGIHEKDNEASRLHMYVAARAASVDMTYFYYYRKETTDDPTATSR